MSNIGASGGEVSGLSAEVTADAFVRMFPGESDRVEFKQSLGIDKVREAVAAFSNSDGGSVLLGVRDDGARVPSGFRLDHEKLAKIHRLVSDIRDPGRYFVQELRVDDVSIALINVERRRQGFAQLPDGRILVRRGAMNQALFGDSLVRFLAGRATSRFEVTPQDIRLTDVSPSLMDDLREAWGWSRGADLLARLHEHGLIEVPDQRAKLTVAGVLYLTDRPDLVLGKSYVEVYRYRDAGENYDRRTRITGPLHRQVAETTRVLQDELGADLIVLGLRRHELPRVPEVVIREAIANAVAHRVYEDHRRPVRVELRPKGVVIVSPGSLPEPVTVDNIREQNSPRNLCVIDTLRRFGLAEDAGRGVDVMQDTMLAALLDPPGFVDDGDSVAVTLPTSSSVTPAERAWIEEVADDGSLHPDDRLLLVYAARGEQLTNRSVRKRLGMDSVEVRVALQRLRDAGYLRQAGQHGGAHYVLADTVRPATSRSLGRDDLRRTVLDLAAREPVTNESVRKLTGLDRTRVTALLRSLVSDGDLRREGERRGIRYVLPDR